MKKYILYLFLFFGLNQLVLAQNLRNNPSSNHGNKFEQLGTILPDANVYRSASGAPGHSYWQQQADYKIAAELDEKNLRLNGEETITYTNNSPDALSYLWLQLDENQHQPNAQSNFFDGSSISLPLTNGQLDGLNVRQNLEGYGVNIISVTDTFGRAIPYTINQTMMRIDLPKILKSKQKVSFRIKWNYKLPERMKIGGRGGYERFGSDSNCTFTITQWYPRMCVYNDYGGWNNKQFTGRGEFSLAFGNFEVSMRVPADHVVASTGVCLNPKEVLTPAQLARWNEAQKASAPIEVVTLEEAKAREKNPDTEHYKTWKYKAENVRDFAWGSSRKFVWDAMMQPIATKKVMCMSYYPKEAYGLYNRYSTKTVAHTIRVYSKHTIDYPYPTAISVEAANGMEYPMICFNFGRTDEDGTYSSRTKYGMIGVIIHEVGHNFFPMIINSDERQWSWMDEGLNTFVQFLTEQEFDNNYPSARGPAHKIADYMSLPKEQLEPIMTNSENINQFGPNAYAKPATALNILRETVMGRELFDYAFKEYSRRWAFKHPTPSDFFRTMEDASGVDLDWFWRGWFYDIEPVDIALDSVTVFTVSEPKGELTGTKRTRKNRNANDDFLPISRVRNKASGMQFLVDQDTTLRDFYYYYKPEIDTVTKVEPRFGSITPMNAEEVKKYENNFYYQLNFSNIGGLVMPIIIQWNYEDGTQEVEYISAYIWRKNEYKVSKVFAKNKRVTSILLDPYKETADINESNNSWPSTPQVSRFDIYKAKTLGRGQFDDENPMKKARK
ncbi:MAG: M1 family metallopeptidase [Bacteroidia bacterium]|nr:M1 family metallopeptidase [Bacteroidia bacterium]MCF8427870.1 M1 family metallopeptidase [Bacteroidia bacterium]MCF8446619.1 M1 family metallopeptidase [Bacteroidia bacterium]